MEEGTKKRKPPSFNCQLHEEGELSCKAVEEVENEEEKVKQFFAILQGLQEARDRLIKRSSSDHALHNKETTTYTEGGHRGKKVKLGQEDPKVGEVSVWMPSFQREDFMPEPEREPYVNIINSSQKSEPVAANKKNDEEVKEAVDLRLSL